MPHFEGGGPGNPPVPAPQGPQPEPQPITIDGHLNVTIPVPHSLIPNGQSPSGDEMFTIGTNVPQNGVKPEPSTVTGIVIEGVATKPGQRPKTFSFVPGTGSSPTVKIFFKHP